MWEYAKVARDVIRDWVTASQCAFCSSPLELIRETDHSSEFGGDHHFTKLRVRQCRVCGWWSVNEEEAYFSAGRPRGCPLSAGEGHIERGACGSLLDLDLQDIALPINEVRRYLAAKYEQRFVMAPRLFEDVVASVFRDLQFDVIVTGYHGGGGRRGDDGIDVVLRGADGSTIGVQVKRYRGKISVEQLRALAGALLLGGVRKGVFVTTSAFQSGAQSTVDRYAIRGYHIELVDAMRFYDALKLAQSTTYSRPSEVTVQRWVGSKRELDKSFISMRDSLA